MILVVHDCIDPPKFENIGNPNDKSSNIGTPRISLEDGIRIYRIRGLKIKLPDLNAIRKG